jgi:hypothetical protein
MCGCSLIAREGITNLPQTLHAYALKPEKILERSKLRKSVLGSSPGEDDFCSSETKHYRRTAPGPKLFVPAMRLQTQRPETQKTVLGSNPGEDLFCTLETIDNEILIP